MEKKELMMAAATMVAAPGGGWTIEFIGREVTPLERPLDWPLERWFPPDTPEPKPLTECPRCKVPITDRGVACDRCWEESKAADHCSRAALEYGDSGSNSILTEELRAYVAVFPFEAVKPTTQSADATIAKAYDHDFGEYRSDFTEYHVTELSNLIYGLFHTDRRIEQLVQRIAEGRDLEPFFKKAFFKGRTDWELHCAATVDAWNDFSDLPASLEGRAYFRAMDRAEAIFEILQK